MAITGTHVLLYTTEPEKLRAVFRDVFNWHHVDAGNGWLIFKLPPAELAVHPAAGPTLDSGMRHQITFMCDDIHKTIVELKAHGVEVVGEPKTESYGITTTLRLPGGCDVMMYQPRHAIAADIRSPKAAKKSKKGTSKKKNATAPKGRRAKKAPRRR